MSMPKRTFVPCLTLLLLAGCASQESFSVPVMRPAAVALGQHDLVAVDRFAGSGAEEFGVELSDALRNAVNPLTGSNDFEIVDRRDVDQMLDDMRRYGNRLQTGDDSPVGKWQSARIMIRGQVSDYGVEESVEAKEFVDPRTGVVHVEFCRRAVALIDVTIEAVDGEGARLFDRVQYREAAQAATESVEPDPPSIDHASLLAAVRGQVIDQYMRRVMPHTEYVTVHLYTDGDLGELAMGNGFAKTGDWAEALRSYRSAEQACVGDLAELRFKALYNAGVAHLHMNHFDDARTALKQAYAASRDDVILAQINRVGQREAEYMSLREQGQQAMPQR